MKWFALAVILLLTACSTKPTLEVINRPIQFDEQRKALTLQYLKDRYGMVQVEPTITPKMVVVHWTVVPTLEKTFKVFDPPLLASSRTQLTDAGALNVSAHYLVDRDGTIYQIMPLTTMARHVIGLNHSAIGIENIADGKTLPLTDEQIEANIKIISYLSELYPIDYVIGHHEYQQFIGHELWKETDPGYLTIKTDPGDANMRRIRARLARLDLKPLPNP